jgi:spermidine synthase
MRMRKPQVVEIDYVQRMLASLLWLPSAERWGRGRRCNWGWAPVPSRASRQAVEDGHHGGGDQPAGGQRLPSHFQACPPTGRAWCWATPPTGWRRPCPPACAAACGPVRPRSRRAGAGRRGLLPPPAAGAGRRRADERQFVRPPRQLPCHSATASHGAFGTDQVWSLRPRAKATPWWWPGRGVVVPPRENCCSARRCSSSVFGPGLPARKWLRMVRPYTPAESEPASADPRAVTP